MLNDDDCWSSSTHFDPWGNLEGHLEDGSPVLRMAGQQDSNLDSQWCSVLSYKSWTPNSKPLFFWLLIRNKPLIGGIFCQVWASLVAQLVKNLPAMQETWVWSLDWEDSLEKRKATHSSILAWRIPWTIGHGVAKSQTRLSNFHFHFTFCQLQLNLTLINSNIGKSCIISSTDTKFRILALVLTLDFI